MKQHREATKTRGLEAGRSAGEWKLKALAAVTASASATAGLTGPALAQKTSSGVDVTPPAPNVTVTGEGDCSTLHVEVSAPLDQEYEGYAFGLDYTVTEDCYVVLGDSTLWPADQDNSSGGDASESVAAGLGPTAGGEAVAAAWTSNYVHSSQTMQDVINIDIAKFRFSHRRHWNGEKTYFNNNGDGHMRASTSVGWNHPVAVQSDGWTQDPYTEAHSYAHGDFHSDFLWCNFQPGQNFTMYTALDGFRGGGFDARFSQNRACSGTHMATSKSSNGTKWW